MRTGIEEYILKYRPECKNIKANRYEEVFSSPWATSSEQEKKHRFLMESIGNALQGENEEDQKGFTNIEIYQDMDCLGIFCYTPALSSESPRKAWLNGMCPLKISRSYSRSYMVAYSSIWIYALFLQFHK